MGVAVGMADLAMGIALDEDEEDEDWSMGPSFFVAGGVDNVAGGVGNVAGGVADIAGGAEDTAGGVLGTTVDANDTVLGLTLLLLLLLPLLS